MCLHLRGTADNPRGVALRDEVLLAFNRTRKAQDLTLPESVNQQWVRHIDTACATQEARAVQTKQVSVPPASLSIFSLTPNTVS